MAAWLTQKDVEDYGPDVLDLAQRAALHAVSPELQRINDQNESLRRQLAAEQRRGLYQSLDAQVPNWRETTVWSGGSGWRSRMICLEPPGNNTAMRPWREVMPRASPRSSVVFSAKRVSPRRGSSRSKRQITGQRTYTRADITRYSDAYRRGRISEGDYQKISADIVAAGREGRIVGVNPRTHCYACANSQDR